MCTVHTSVLDPDPVGSASFLADPDPDWDRHPGPIRIRNLPPNVRLNYTFSRKFQYTVQNIENYDKYDADPQNWCIHLYSDQYILIHVCVIKIRLSKVSLK